MIHVSILTVASESAQASVRLAKEVKMVNLQKKSLQKKSLKKAVKPEVEEKLKEQSKNLKTESHLIAKNNRNNEMIHVSILTVASESAQASPEVEEKIERAIEEFEETEITLDCEKQQEQEMIHVLHSDCGFRISSSISALSKEVKMVQPAEEIIAEEIIEKAVKPEVEEKIERAIEEFEETEITLDCEKQQEQEMIHVSILTVASESAQASVRLAKEVKMVQPAEEIIAEEIIEKAVKPEVEEKIERAIEEFEETEITLDCEKQQEHEMIHVSILTVASESAQASVRLAKEVKMVQPAEEIIAEEIIEKAVKPEVEEKIERAIEEFEERKSHLIAKNNRNKK
uniref:Titin-like n=1 Tax=Loa loa TaxID=7209 RepID=A0A1I7VJ95_LOALO